MLEFTARKHQVLRVTSRQAEILFGALLGDAYITPRGQIQIAHSIKQTDYVKWKYYELKSLAYGPPTQSKRFDSRYDRNYIQVRFWLRQFFRPWRKLFYPDGYKVFPVELSHLFTELALAVWYMDDGNLYNEKHLKIATDEFDEKCRRSLQNILFTKFGLKSTIHASGKLRISAVSLPKFFQLVRPYVHSSMIYKIP